MARTVGPQENPPMSSDRESTEDARDRLRDFGPLVEVVLRPSVVRGSTLGRIGASATVKLMVDSGAAITCVPDHVVLGLNIRLLRKERVLAISQRVEELSVYPVSLAIVTVD